MSHKCEHGKDSDVCVQCREEKNMEPRMTAPLPPKTKSASQFARELNNISDKRRLWAGDISKRGIQIAKAALTRACKIIQKRADDYDAEHGHTDLETGQREYPKNGDEYMLELTEIIESIAAARDNLKDIDDL